jgi:hypothetical protein
LNLLFSLDNKEIPDNETPVSKTEKVRNYLNQGYNCAQAIMAAFACDDVVPPKKTLRLKLKCSRFILDSARILERNVEETERKMKF